MATLTTTITESLILNGAQRGGTQTKSFTGINESSKGCLPLQLMKLQ